MYNYRRAHYGTNCTHIAHCLRDRPSPATDCHCNIPPIYKLTQTQCSNRRLLIASKQTGTEQYTALNVVCNVCTVYLHSLNIGFETTDKRDKTLSKRSRYNPIWIFSALPYLKMCVYCLLFLT